MDYKKKYKEALERARVWKEKSGMPKDKQGILDDIFPELAESEDEKIRKELLKFLEGIWHLGKNAPFEKWDKSDCSKWIAWLEKQSEPQDKGEISDGYHTFNELYYYRMLYNAAFFNMLPKEWVHKSKRHNDGEECFGGGWFIVMANLPTGQISNHYELKDWDLFQIPEKEVADKWDGHTPQKAADRLHKYLLEKQGEQKPNPYSGTSFEYNGHTWGMCARDNGVDILCDKHIIGHLDKQGQTYTKRDVDDAWLKGKCDAKRELEKQCKQKPIEWDEYDEMYVSALIAIVKEDATTPNLRDTLTGWLRCLKGRFEKNG